MTRAEVEEGGRSGAELHLRVEYPDIQSFLTDYRENIIHGSTFISSQRVWKVGDRLKISLTFPGLLTPLTLPGTVSWTQTERDRGVGVEFTFHDNPVVKKDFVERAEAIERGDPHHVARLIKVLLAEDNPMLCEMLREGLNKHANRSSKTPAVFVFHTAQNGSEALKIIEEKPIDVLITDISLPVLDGKTLIRSCRELFGVQFPIIATSTGGQDAESIAIGAGADVFLSKPLRLVSVFDSMSQLLCLDLD